MLHVKLISISIFMTLILQVVAGKKCKWSNEDCSGDSECCSKTCEQVHPGTNHRCTQNPMDYACIYDYHCESRLICGSGQRCCAAEWGACMLNSHCCERQHDCIVVEGFTYKRCLESNSPRRLTVSVLTILTGLFSALGFWLT